MMSKANTTAQPDSPNEQAHAFADAVENVSGVTRATVKRGAFSGDSYVSVRVPPLADGTADADLTALTDLAREYGAGNMDADTVLGNVCVTFQRGDA